MWSVNVKDYRMWSVNVKKDPRESWNSYSFSFFVSSHISFFVSSHI